MKHTNTKINTIIKFFLLLTLLSFGNAFGQQVIGSFPNIQGGFESQSMGTVTTSLATATQYSNWILNNVSSANATISTTGGRSGPYYGNYTSTSSSSSTRRISSPTVTAENASGFQISTSYVIQYYYRTTGVANFGTNINIDGSSNWGTSESTGTLASTSGAWVKRTVVLTTNAGTSPAGISASSSRYGHIQFRSNASMGTGASIDIDDVVVYAGSSADVTAPSSPGAVTVNNATTTSLDVSWGAASGGVDGGGYLVMRYSISPNANNDPNANGIYAIGNTTTNGTGSLTGTVAYIGTGISFTDSSLASNTTYYYKVYTVDKAFNYSAETSNNGTTLPLCSIPTTPTNTNPSAICQGSTTTITGTGSTNAVSYTFWDSASGGTQYTNGVNGYTVTTTALTTPSSLASTTIYYVQGENGSCISASRQAVTVTVNTPPSISVNPSGSSIAIGGNTTFSVTASGTGITYQWQVNTGSGFANIINSAPYSNATTSTLSITAATYSMNGYSYQCVVSGTSPCAAVTSVSATLTIAPSSSSNIIRSTGFTEPVNIAYASYQTTNIVASGASSNNIKIAEFTIQDGGGTSDADASSTILNAITFTVTNSSNIRRLALYDNSGAAFVGTEQAGGSSITFSGLTLTALDNGSKTFSVYASFNTSVTDNQNIGVTVSSTATGVGSTFAALNAGGAASIASGNSNKIVVVADRLYFIQQPTTTSQNGNMSPSPKVGATDVYNNVDLDVITGSVSITSTGTLSTTPQTASITLGIATFGTINHTALGTGFQLTATASGFTTATSSLFDVVLIPTGSFRSTSAGTWSGATWETYSSGAWTASAAPSISETNYVYVRHLITSGSGLAPATVVVASGGTFQITAAATVGSSLLVQTGGVLQMDADLTINGTLEVEDDATFNFNYNGYTASGLDATLWHGTEMFHPNSNFVIQNYSTTIGTNFFLPSETSVATYTDTTNANFAACFGNLIFNSLAQTTSFALFSSSFTKNLTHKDLILRSTLVASGFFRFQASALASFSTTIGRDFIIESGFGRESYIVNQIVAATLNIKGNLKNDSAKSLTLLNNSDPTAEITLNIDGNISASGSGTIDIKGVSGGNSTTNLKGDLTIGANALLICTGTDIARNLFNFTGTGDGSTAALTQNIDIASTGATKNKYTTFNVTSGAYVQLANNDFMLGNNSILNVNTGGVFDFGFSGTTPLVAGISGSATGTAFSSKTGSTLKITSPDGINTSGSLGNVQVTASNRSFDQTATFYYIGKANQTTGNAISTGGSAKTIVCEMNTTNLQLSFTNSTSITTPGLLDIRKGQVIESATNYITGSTGGLTMADGTLYQIAALSVDSSDYIPRMTGISTAYNLSGTATIELNGADDVAKAYDQYLRGARDYRNLTFSSNGTKTVSSDPTSITGTILVKDAAVLDVDTKTMGGIGTNLTMTGTSEYKTAGTGTKPDAQGAYALGIGTKVSFTNVVATLESVRLSPSYYNIDIVGSSVGTDTTTGAINIQTGGTFKVKDSGIFKFSNTAGFTGGTTTAISNATVHTDTLESTSIVEYAGANQTVTTFSPYYAFLKFSGSGIKTIPTSAIANTYIDVNKDLTVTGVTLQVNNNDKNLNLNYNTYLTVTNQFTNSAGTVNFEDGSSLIQVTDGIANSGNVNYKRITNIRKTDYVYWSTPVTAFGVNNIWFTANNIYKWNTTTPNTNGGIGDWESASGASMSNGIGYIVRGPSGTSLNSTPSDYPATFTGVPNNGSVAVTITKGSFTGPEYPGTNGTTITNYDDNMNLVGNPYPSAINAHDFLAANANIEGSIQVWTHGTQLSNTIASPYYGSFAYNYTSADYITYNDLGASSGPSTFNGYIGAGQAFFVKMLDAAAGTTVTFTNAMRSKGYTNNKFYRIRNPQRVEPRDIDSNPVERNRIWLDLIAPTGAAVRTLVGYVAGATLDKDRMYDAYSDYENDQNFFSLIGKEIMSIQGRPLPFNINDAVPMGVAIPKTGNYTIAIGAVDGLFEDKQQTIYLEDKLLNIVHDLSATPYSFDIDKGIVKDRFVLRYTNPLGTTIFKNLDNSIVVAVNAGQIKIKSFIEDIKTITIYDVLGRELYAKDNLNIQDFFVNAIAISQQALIIKITLANGQTVTRKIVY